MRHKIIREDSRRVIAEEKNLDAPKVGETYRHMPDRRDFEIVDSFIVCIARPKTTDSQFAEMDARRSELAL